MIRKEAQTFNDGVVTISAVVNVALPGFRPQMRAIPVYSKIRYERRTVGVTRFWGAKAVQERVDELIRIPKCGPVTIDQTAELEDGRKFAILQVQQPKGVYPLCLDLSLREVSEGDDEEEDVDNDAD